MHKMTGSRNDMYFEMFKERILHPCGCFRANTAVICAVQAAWAARQPGYGLPARVPRAEGWIITA